MSTALSPRTCSPCSSLLSLLSLLSPHALSHVHLLQDPRERLLLIVRWFLGNYYKKPRGLKKPYNPLLGEVFRCMYELPATATTPASRCHVLLEQVAFRSLLIRRSATTHP